MSGQSWSRLELDNVEPSEAYCPGVTVRSRPKPKRHGAYLGVQRTPYFLQQNESAHESIEGEGGAATVLVSLSLSELVVTMDGTRQLPAGAGGQSTLNQPWTAGNDSIFF